MRKYTVRRGGNRDLSFTGESLAATTSEQHDGPSSSRWWELRLYKTAAGALVGERIGRTLWQGEVDRFEAVVGNLNDGKAEITLFFGYSDAAKELYEKAGIDTVEKVE